MDREGLNDRILVLGVVLSGLWLVGSRGMHFLCGGLVATVEDDTSIKSDSKQFNVWLFFCAVCSSETGAASH